MRRISLAFRLFLVLALALVSGHTAVGRAEARAAQVIELCSGYGVTTVTLDAKGKPIRRHYSCPDCVLSGLATAPVMAPAQAPPRPARRIDLPAATVAAATPVAPMPAARGPPVPALA